MWQDEAVLAVSGYSGAGKTTLLEAAIPQLVARGLRVAAVKHDAHGLSVDHPGKDSDRLFVAGADVAVSGPGQSMWRRHLDEDHELESTLVALLADHDLVLIEGHKRTPLPKVWLAGDGPQQPPPEAGEILTTLVRSHDLMQRFLDLVDDRLRAAQVARPVLGGLLIGGRSRRMGRAKHLVEVRGELLIDRVAAALQPHVQQLVVLGAGRLPDAWQEVPRLADPPGVHGPIAGLLAALRWQPRASWLLAACDLPRVSPEAAAWLLQQRAPGRWAVLPVAEGGRLQPLLAVYEPQAGRLVEELVAGGGRAPRALVDHARVFAPCVPAHLAAEWSNANTPGQLRDLA